MNPVPIVIVAISIILMITAIALDWKIKFKSAVFGLYWVFCLIGAITCLLYYFIAPEVEPINLGEVFLSNANINPLKILVIFISCTSISVVLDKIGFFSYIAAIILTKSKSSQKKLFFSFSAIIAILTIFTSNDILILTFTPFICYFSKNAKINPLPYIISEFVCANVWSMFFFIDNPTNIYMCTTFDISFIEYAVNMAVPTILSGIFSTFLVYFIFRKTLNQKIEIQDVEIVKPDRTFLTIGLIGLGIMVLFMAISNYIPGVELWYVPLVCSVATYIALLVSMIIKKGGYSILWKALKGLPYALIPFLLSMSIFIVSLENAGFIGEIASFLSNQHMFVTGLISFGLGNLLNNIPMTMMFTNTLAAFTNHTETSFFTTVYGVVAASNITALLTPIGSLAGIMFMKILKENEVKYSFGRFVFYGIFISIPTICLALAAIYFMPTVIM